MAITVYRAANDSYKIVNENEKLLEKILSTDKISQIDTPEFVLRKNPNPFNPKSKLKKPIGTWYAYGTSWLELMGITSKPDLHLFRLEIDISKMLVLTEKNIAHVCRVYGSLENGQHIVNWNLVCMNHYGVEIKDLVSVSDAYMKAFNTKLIPCWLEYWDVPGGCVWNGAAIDGFTKI